MSKPFAKDRLGRNVYMAEHGKVDSLPSGVDTFLEALAPFMGWKDKGRHVWVSDLSEVSDFGLDAKQINNLSRKLGVKISRTDYIHEVAKRIEAKRAADSEKGDE